MLTTSGLPDYLSATLPALVKAVSRPWPVDLPGFGPRIVLCLRGEARLSAGGEVQVVGGGEAVFVSAVEPAVTLRGEDAVVFQASVGSLGHREADEPARASHLPRGRR